MTATKVIKKAELRKNELLGEPQPVWKKLKRTDEEIRNELLKDVSDRKQEEQKAAKSAAYSFLFGE
jgi:hypothetical protein